MTEKELRRAEAAYRAASVRLEKLREKRNQAVREALAAGWTHAKIAEATGLTRGRINQLKDEEAALLRRAGFFPWGKDAWIHRDDEGHVMTTKEAVERASNRDG